MRVVEETVVRRIDDRLAREKLPQQRRPARPVDAGQTGDNPAIREHKLFGLSQDASGFTLGIGWTLLGDPLARGLRIDARAAREKKKAARKSRGEMARAREVNSAIILRLPAARTRAMDDQIHRARGGDDGGGIRDIDPTHSVRLRG